MDVSVSDAKGQLTELVRRAQAGDEVVLTRHGHAVVRLVPVVPQVNTAARKSLINAVRVLAASKTSAGTPAANSQDFLYDANGLPG